jgi:hypothetical protein
MNRPSQTSSIRRGAPILCVVLALLATLVWPLLFTYSGFAGDWEHHLWLMWHQSRSIQSNGSPTLYLNSSYSVFYPTYAFYGGTLYAIGGALSLALGESPVSAYVLVYVLDFAAAFAGWYWLGRMAGVGRWLAIVPGLVFVTSAYYIVVIYVQGDWPEFTGISMIPLLAAAGLSVLLAERVGIGAAIALALSSVLFFGSHNVTIMLAGTMLALIGVATLLCIPDARRALTWRRSGRVACVVVPAAAVSAWYLLPALAYSSSTRIGSQYRQAQESLRSTAGLVSLGHLLSFSRTSGPGLPAPYYLSLSLPVLAILWVLAGLLVLPTRSRNRAWLRLLLICSGTSIVITVVMTHVGLLLALPRPYSLIQFSYRLEVYVLLALCAAIVAALALARGGSRRSRIWTWMALPVCAVSLLGGIWQISQYPYPGQDRYVTLGSYGEVETGGNRDFQDVSEPVIAGRGLDTVDIPPGAVHADRVSFSERVRPGTLLATDIGAGRSLVDITGARAVGIDSETGDMVLQVASGDGTGTGGRGDAGTSDATASEATITVSSGSSLPIVLGRVLTLAGLATLLVELLVLVTRRLGRRLTETSEAS